MFERESPRLFGLPCGVDFAEELVQGLRNRLADQPPEAMARVELFVSTRRMARRIRAVFDAGPPTLLPRIRLITDLAQDPTFPDFPPAVPGLRRRLELTQLVSKLLDTSETLAPRAALFDLADSLASLLDEMQGEGVPPSVVAGLDVSEHSGHWQRTQAFLDLVSRYFEDDAEPDMEQRQRRIVETLARLWENAPPEHPIIVAGSTGSRGTTALFLRAVLRLPQGAVVLPGVDTHQPREVWDQMSDALSCEDHPQFRFVRIAHDAGMHPADIPGWTGTPAPCPPRNALMSLALRPAPVTDQWLRDGPQLTGLGEACASMTLLDAPTRRQEALAIALRLRKAAEDGTIAALITPDRMLTRQVAATLDRWGIRPDDSAGIPLPLTPAGRLLRQVGSLMGGEITAEALLGLMKHPLVHRGVDRGPHLNRTRDLELHIRRKGMPFPTRDVLHGWAERRETDTGAKAWVDWIFDTANPCAALEQDALSGFVARHISAAEAFCAGANATETCPLWDGEAGEEAARIVGELRDEAHHGGSMSAHDYGNLFRAILNRGEVRETATPHPKVLIWGTMEARMQGADLLILAGLNDGSWPEPPAPDPWLNREMRHRAGLLLPDRRIGLSAHDFQQAMGGAEVWLSRSIRSDEAETVPSRWLSRLTNLLEGLPMLGGPDRLAEMRARGAEWLKLAQALEDPGIAPRAPRPSPKPPVEFRPKQLSVTEISRLIRDPYAIHARHVLRLKRLDPITQSPDAPLRGTAIHDVLDTFLRRVIEDPSRLNRADLLATAEAQLEGLVPWPATRAIWIARIGRFADWFIEQEKRRRLDALPVGTELRGRMHIGMPDFTLTAMADRIDRRADGALVLLDYKTGKPKTPTQQRAFEKQLLLEAVMAEAGAFEGLDPAPVAQAVYVGLTSKPADVLAPIDKEPPAETLEGLRALIAAYLDPETGFTARRAMEKQGFGSDYDTLSRFGEWDETQDPEPEILI
ncbi:double-strand break repair protein AddB [Poseidonocella pacifica]|uniref:Double-strand break repair protein AddB n=1 Tax=Poseidonocella pacifica TaxID=871651 RepID=A0A1I0XVU2_9RHOB|nr:double-strand break repair protein AddB [Poseidonocella pacifica]SFB04566.1 double-strand break repair protein AddB [Poseidonocella pacifica]